MQELQLPHLDFEIAQKIDQQIEQLMKHNPAQRSLFEFPVSSEEVPDYYGIISVGMWIDLIRKRLSNGYYRQVIKKEENSLLS